MVYVKFVLESRFNMSFGLVNLMKTNNFFECLTMKVVVDTQEYSTYNYVFLLRVLTSYPYPIYIVTSCYLSMYVRLANENKRK